MSGSSRQQRRVLCDQIIGRFALPPAATYRDACRRTGEVMSELLDERVELRFVALRGAPFSGATVRRVDGTYVVYCAKSRSWYHRLGILLHELAHVVLGHEPISATDSAASRRFLPHLPRKMARVIAGRTGHSQDAERQAEELADQLLERLTERRPRSELGTDRGATGVAPHVMRIAEGLAPSSRPADGPDR